MTLTVVVTRWLLGQYYLLDKYKSLHKFSWAMAVLSLITSIASFTWASMLQKGTLTGDLGSVGNLFFYSTVLFLVFVAFNIRVRRKRIDAFLNLIKYERQNSEVPGSLLKVIANSTSLSDDAKIMVGNAMEGNSAFTFGELFAIEEAIKNASGRDAISMYATKNKLGV